ncbi:MAG: NADH-quinone oxidoreductase subunit M [Thermoleophilia bacterium]
MLTTVLVFLPLAAALLLWASPFRTTRQAGAFALLVAAAELVLWIVAVADFDYGIAGLQHATSAVWFGDLGVSYKVGLYDYSLWLIGLTVVGSLAAIGYAVYAGRERARAYFGLMLFLLGATVGVFAAQDLLLFYVFFEAMLIPLYVLLGVWGGANRQGATIKFLIYTVAGSLLMLVAIVAYGLEADTFDLTQMRESGSTWIFLGFLAAFAVKAPLWPFHGWLPDAYRQAPPEVAALLSGVISKTAAYGLLRIALPSFPEPIADLRTPILVLASIGLVYGSLLAFRQPDFRGVVAYSSLGQMNLIMLGLFAFNDSGINGALVQMVNHGLVSTALFLMAGFVELRTGTGEFRLLGGMARGRPVFATMLIALGVIALAVPGSGVFAGEFLILNGVFSVGWGYAVVGAIAIVLAAMYMLRAISATLHVDVGGRVDEKVKDLRLPEVAVVLPLLGILLLLSFWPAGITDNSFGGEPAASVGDRFEAPVAADQPPAPAGTEAAK